LKAISVDIPVEKLRNKMLKEWVELILDTTVLIWTDTIVKVVLNEWLPSDRDEIVKYLYKELEEIIPILIWLKALNKGKEKMEVVIMWNDRVKINWKEYAKKELVWILNKPNPKKESKWEKSEEKESVDYAVDTRLYKLESINLEQVLKWFKKEDKLDERFEKILMGNNNVAGILEKWNKVIKEIVFEKVREIKQGEELTIQDIYFVDKITKKLGKEYEKALYETVKVIIWKQKEISKEYWNSEVVRKLMIEIIKKGLGERWREKATQYIKSKKVKVRQ